MENEYKNLKTIQVKSEYGSTDEEISLIGSAIGDDQREIEKGNFFPSTSVIDDIYSIDEVVDVKQESSGKMNL